MTALKRPKHMNCDTLTSTATAQEVPRQINAGTLDSNAVTHRPPTALSTIGPIAKSVQPCT